MDEVEARDELLDLGRTDLILLADRCEAAEALVRTLGEALEAADRAVRDQVAAGNPVSPRVAIALSVDARSALSAYRAWLSTLPDSPTTEER